MITDDQLLNPGAPAPVAAPTQRDDAWLDALLAQETAEPERPTQAAQQAEDPIAKLRQLVAQRAPSGPGDLERAYASENEAPGGSRKLAAVGDILSELFGGRGGMAAQHDARRLQYQQGLTGARAQDRASAPVDLSTAELLMKAGLSPEAAAGTRGDSPALKLSNNLGMIDTRQRGQDMTAQQKADHDQWLLTLAGVNNQSREGIADKRITSQEGIAGGRNDTAIKVAGIRAKKGGAGGSGPKSPEQQAKEDESTAAWLAQQSNLPYAKSLAFVRGQTEGISPDEAERLQVNLAQFGAVDKEKLMRASLTREGATPDRIDASVATKQRDPKVTASVRNELLDQQQAITAAINGWKSMSPGARDAFVKTGGGDPSMLANLVKTGAMTPKEQSAAGAIWALANTQIKKFAGSAVTGSEWGRQAKDIGLADNNADIFNSTQRMSDWLQKAANVYRGTKRSYEASYPDLWKGMQNE